MVAFHMYWPSSLDPFYQANTTQNNARKTYYGVNATPTLKVDGVLDIWPISVTSVTDAISQRLAVPCHIWLDASCTVEGTTVYATVKAVSDIDITGNKVIQMIVVNRYSYYPNSPNGNPNFYASMRMMAPTADGQPFTTTAGDTATYIATFRLNPAWSPSGLDLVCFVQDNGTKEVLQARMESVTPQPGLPADITLTPVNPPIQIPAQGGSFSFDATIHNSADSTLRFYAWIMQQTPGGAWQGPMLGPIWVIASAQANIMRTRTQNIPGTAAPGTYTYRGYVGMYNSDARWDSSSFTYVKLTTGSGPAISDWENTGESFDLTEAEQSLAAVAPRDYAVTSVTPNPFNPTTEIRYQILEARQVSLRVYDTAGRLVATLVEGVQPAGTHQATFDGSSLPSGVYLYRLTAGANTATGKMVLLK